MGKEIIHYIINKKVPQLSEYSIMLHISERETEGGVKDSAPLMGCGTGAAVCPMGMNQIISQKLCTRVRTCS